MEQGKKTIPGQTGECESYAFLLEIQRLHDAIDIVAGAAVDDILDQSVYVGLETGE